MTRAKRTVKEIELEIALENRAFEIQLFWQRSNYFLVLMTALGIGVFTIKSPFYSFVISTFSAITSWYWYQTNLGSKFWQESWEVEVVELAKEQGIRSFERPTEDIIQQVSNSLLSARAYPSDAHWRKRLSIGIRRLIDKQIVKKPSVSHYMILLSASSIVLWTVVAGVHGYDLLTTLTTTANKAPSVSPPPPRPADKVSASPSAETSSTVIATPVTEVNDRKAATQIPEAVSSASR